MSSLKSKALYVVSVAFSLFVVLLAIITIGLNAKVVEADPIELSARDKCETILPFILTDETNFDIQEVVTARESKDILFCTVLVMEHTPLYSATTSLSVIYNMMNQSYEVGRG